MSETRTGYDRPYRREAVRNDKERISLHHGNTFALGFRLLYLHTGPPMVGS
jgi:hypothetical protein